MKTCTVDGCNSPHLARGWCQAHYRRWRIHGDVQADKPVLHSRGLGADERFWALVDRQGEEDECWPWRGSPNRGGYGWFAIEFGRGIAPHRYAYQTVVGPIPDGLQVDHRCRNRVCVNPAHLEPVTPGENQRRADVALGIRTAVTHCPKGHPYDEANTYIRPPNGARVCRECGRVATRAYLARKAAEQRERPID